MEGTVTERLPDRLPERLPDRAEIVARLSSAVLSDVMDDLGLGVRAMRPFVRPLDEAQVLFGPARTGLYAPVFHRAPGRNPYELEIRLVDDLAPGEVAVLACGGPSERIAPWGEILSTAAAARQAAGCVTDGLIRDTRGIRALGFAVFHGGIAPLNSAGRAEVVAIDEPVECGGVRVASGDLVFGDCDGVVAVPAARAAEVLALALERVGKETSTRADLLRGMTLRQVYDRHGVL